MSYSQITPRENAQLNYRIIGFSFPKNGSEKYILEIADGNVTTDKTFEAQIISRNTNKNNKIIAEVPTFGSQFTWRVKYVGATTTKSTLHHFSTVMNDRADTTKLRLKILQNEQIPTNNYVSVDAGGVLYDMEGKPVWYMKDNDSISGYVADMEFTPEGTITFIYKNGYEINYNSDVLWKTPITTAVINGYPIGANYHHEFKKLKNGHYMILGAENVGFTLEIKKDVPYISLNKGLGENRNGVMGVITEYDEKGNVVWTWKASEYLFSSDFAYYEAYVDTTKQSDPHDNAFFFDEKTNNIYVSFRNLNRIVKISYPDKKVVAEYGQNYKDGSISVGQDLFCNQHSINISDSGYMYFFNNNSCKLEDMYPSVVILKESKPDYNKLEEVWSYNCISPNEYTKRFASGGNVKELGNHSIFVNMGGIYSNLFIVDRDKKKSWSALPERYMQPDRKWTPIREYRANIITRKQLEQLIWNAEKIK